MTRHILVANVFFAPFSYGGATVVAEEVAKSLIALGGYRITAVSLCSRSDLAPYVLVKSQKEGIVNYLINVPPDRRYAEMYDNPEVTARLAELVSALEPDLIHAHCIQEIGTGIVAVGETMNIPVILSTHDFWWLCDRQFMLRLDQSYCGQFPVRIKDCRGCVDNYWAARLRFEHLQAIGQKAALITYPSQFAKTLSEASGFGPNRGVVWENGVRLPSRKFFEAQAIRRAKDPRVTFGYVGGPAQIKGWPQIREAFADMTRTDFRCVVVDGGLDRPWWKKADFRSLPGDWQIHPRYSQETMDAFYAEIDVLLFMSQWKETFGLAIREAIARGIDVIQTDSGGTVEHPLASRADLIPIGAPAHHLRGQIEGRLAQGHRRCSPEPVASFDVQARNFAALVEGVLNNLHRAA